MNKFIKILFTLLILFLVFIFIVHRSGTYKTYKTEEIRAGIPYMKVEGKWDWENFRNYLEKLYVDCKGNFIKFFKKIKPVGENKSNN